MYLGELAASVQRPAFAAPDLAAGRPRDAAPLDEHHNVGRCSVGGGNCTDDLIGRLAPFRDRVASDLGNDDEPLQVAVVVSECRTSAGTQRRETELLDGVLDVLGGIVDTVFDHGVFGAAGDVHLTVDNA